ncbi:MAG: tartrate-resistant acid phosphatase type 5 family protein [Bacteroidetes bacterium]|nr:tartrate-resistant acid phosphatase type 5 family protein [Bacteroidota bacterium]
MQRKIRIIFFAVILAGCGTSPAPGLDELASYEDAFSFLIVGDFGRNGYHGQQEVADMMSRAGDIMDIEFVATTGDNFYDNGVASVHDPLIQSAFEDIYDGPGLLVDWYVSLGNHEYRGNIQALIDYADISRRWNMPARYYQKSFDTEDFGVLDLFVVDTSPFEDEYYSEAKYFQVAEQDSSAQMAWLNEALGASTADWKIVVGHHPLITGGNRRDDPRHVAARLEPILARHGVDAYFAGHEHDLQHLVTPLGVHNFISGAGSELRPTGTIPETRYAESRNGFMSASIDSSGLTVHVVDALGDIRYQTTLPAKPRN